jgi:tRNA threonylcarbamoyladenosine biosynthesis protein TsaB
MRLLLIDTCGHEGNIALAEGDELPRIVASEVLPGRSASERLLPVIRERMEAAGWKLNELAAIGVVNGPGSFTGVRVGLSAAKGLSEAGQVPLIAVSRLAILANAGGEREGSICSVLDAGRGEFYAGVYAKRQRVSEALLTIEEVVDISEQTSALIVCEESVREALSKLAPLRVNEPKAADALPFVVGRIADKTFEDVATIDANYLRRTDHEIFAKIARVAG